MDDREYQERLRNGTLPVITSDISDITRRTFVNSEKFPWFPLDGFRVLHNDIIYERKNSWWRFGKWIVKCPKSDYDQVCVLDEAVTR